MTLHKEGYATMIVVFVFLAILNFAFFYFIKSIIIIPIILLVISFVFYLVVVSFFRMPARTIYSEAKNVYAPCDGEVVVIEETVETEYFKDKRIQVSIFMSPLNVHANWYPVSGTVAYQKYHPGKFLVAWHPKSSTENERTTVVVKMLDGKEVLVRQIAGALARRIVCYSKENDKAVQNNQLGFIKFGSRVDVYLPLGTKINVKLDDKVTGTQSVIASF